MDDGDLLGLLTRVNPWWNGQEVQASLKKAEHRRRDFYKIRERLLEAPRRILTIRGPRQVGKTTLSGQLIESLLQTESVAEDRIIYLTIENSRILSNPEGVIEQAIEVYKDSILQRSFRDVDGTVYVFIDEVQKAPDWADTVKYYTDTYSNIQFVATGSLSTLIKSDAGDTLIGRMDEQIMMPLKFIDYLRYHGPMDEEEVYTESTSLRSGLERAVKEKDRIALTGELTRFFGVQEDKSPRIKSLKDELLLKGGYPGVVDESPEAAYQLLDSDLRNTVTGDLCSVFNVDEPQIVLRVLSLLAESTSSTINKSNIADVCGISRQTVTKYIGHLEEFFLINRCPRYRSSEYQNAGRPKMYIQDVGLLNTLSGTMASSTLQRPDEIGPILETVICDHTRRLQFYLSDAQNADIHYWDKRGEVDFVLTGPEYLLPIEVKNGDSTSRDLSGLRNFVDEYDVDFGVCVNNAGVLEQDGDVIHIPAWMYLFMC